MFWWEYLGNHPFLIFLLMIFIFIPTYFISIIGISTNEYFNKMNRRQKRWWFIGIFTGTNLQTILLIYPFVLFLQGWVYLLYYLESYTNNRLIGLIFMILTFIFISLLLFDIMKKKNKSYILRYASIPTNWWEKKLRSEFDVEMYLKDKKEYVWVCYECGKIEKDNIAMGGFIICDDCSKDLELSDGKYVPKYEEIKGE